MQVCTSLQADNHARTPPLSFLQAGCPSCRPANSIKALKAYSDCGKEAIILLSGVLLPAEANVKFGNHLLHIVG